MPPEDKKELTISRALRVLRAYMNVTQQQLADRLGITLRTVVRYENAEPPRGTVLVRLYELALQARQNELADVFRKGIENEPSERIARQANRALQRFERQSAVYGLIMEIQCLIDEVQPDPVRRKLIDEVSNLISAIDEYAGTNADASEMKQ